MPGSETSMPAPAQEATRHICVCICTYKRPGFLRRLLGELRDQETEEEGTDDVDRHRRPEQRLVVERRASDSVACQHTKRASDGHVERRHGPVF